jgi:DNA-binding NarL/FixJ family response regulator
MLSGISRISKIEGGVLGEFNVRIMVIDDSEMWQSQVGQIVEEHPTLEIVATATTAEDAIIKARECLPNVLIMDLNLPGLNGFEAAKRIREDFPKVKVVFLSVEHDPAIIRALLSLRGSAYVKKTRAWAELVKAINAVLS